MIWNENTSDVMVIIVLGKNIPMWLVKVFLFFKVYFVSLFCRIGLLFTVFLVGITNNMVFFFCENGGQRKKTHDILSQFWTQDLLDGKDGSLISQIQFA